MQTMKAIISVRKKKPDNLELLFNAIPFIIAEVIR